MEGGWMRLRRENRECWAAFPKINFRTEAAETLIRNRHAWQLPPDEVRQVIENLRNIRAELQRLNAGQ
jgi:hypothetical protein